MHCKPLSTKQFRSKERAELRYQRNGVRFPLTGFCQLVLLQVHFEQLGFQAFGGVLPHRRWWQL